MNLLIISALCGIAALLGNIFIIKGIVKKDPGDNEMQEIAGHIEEGAMAFLKSIDI